MGMVSPREAKDRAVSPRARILVGAVIALLVHAPVFAALLSFSARPRTTSAHQNVVATGVPVRSSYQDQCRVVLGPGGHRDKQPAHNMNVQSAHAPA